MSASVVKLEVNSNCLAKAYAETEAGASGTSLFNASRTYRAMEWDIMQQKLHACQSQQGGLPNLEITVKTGGNNSRETAIKPIGK